MTTTTALTTQQYLILDRWLQQGGTVHTVAEDLALGWMGGVGDTHAAKEKASSPLTAPIVVPRKATRPAVEAVDEALPVPMGPTKGEAQQGPYEARRPFLDQAVASVAAQARQALAEETLDRAPVGPDDLLTPGEVLAAGNEHEDPDIREATQAVAASLAELRQRILRHRKGVELRAKIEKHKAELVEMEKQLEVMGG